MKNRLAVAVVVAAATLSAACSCSNGTPVPEPKLVPDDVTCSVLHEVADAAALTDALSKARSGECVVASAGTYAGAFTVPAGVTLVAKKDAAVEIAGNLDLVPAVALQAGAAVVDVTVTARDLGVRVDGLKAKLLRTTVRNASNIGLAAWCEEDCGRGDPLASLKDVVLTGNGFGLVVHAAKVVAVGGRIAENVGQEVANGVGVVVSHGGTLEMDGTVVEKNRQVGVLIDGASTTATLKAVAVSSNTGRGVWMQGLRGSDSAPAVTLQGCTVEKNRLVGVGARDSLGVKVSGGRIAQTELATTIVEGGLTSEVGDGVGLFASSQARIEDVELSGNQRAQLLVDSGASGIAVKGGQVGATGTQVGLIVQRTPAGIDTSFAVTVPAANEELSFSAPHFALPAR
ncbi:MAG: right-handed parallel beta-helix repeat-containing protein [Myxococcales bacterium]